MKIEHSSLKNEFISFWFETRVDGVLRFETMLDFMRCDWHTNITTGDQTTVLSGELNSSLSEDEMVEEIKPLIDTAIQSGKI